MRSNSTIAPGSVFGRLTLVERVGSNKNRVTLWLCSCSCGTDKVVMQSSLVTGNTKSCGCFNRQRVSETTAARNATHGMTGSRLYRSWHHMLERCSKPNDGSFANYGGRGITVCPEWLKFEPFRDWALANGYREELSLDRIDNDGNYEPGNCRWATRIEQANNTRVNRRITVAGEVMTVAQASRRYGVAAQTIHTRLAGGWSGESAAMSPVIRNSGKPHPGATYIAGRDGGAE